MRAMAFWMLMFGIVGPCLAEKCDTETDQYGMTQCHANALKATEQSLYDLIAKYRNTLDSKQLALFDEEQAAWLKYRDSYCKFRSSSTAGGSVHGMMLAVCREDLTAARLVNVKRLTGTCAQGDLSCVGTPSGSSRLDSTCGQLKKVIAAHDGLPESGPTGMGWFCDFAQTGSKLDDEWYVVALRSDRTCEDDCSNLMGWYAIHQESGEVHEFDMSEFAVGARISAPFGAVPQRE